MTLLFVELLYVPLGLSVGPVFRLSGEINELPNGRSNIKWPLIFPSYGIWVGYRTNRDRAKLTFGKERGYESGVSWVKY